MLIILNIKNKMGKTNKMSEKKQLTKEEIEKQKKDQRDAAMKIVDPKGNFWNYALPKLITFENFGKTAEIAKRKYNETISKAPDQTTYENLFYPQLATEGGAITSPYLQEMSFRILLESFSRIKVQDALGYLGSKKPVKKDYSNKYLFELPEEQRNTIISSCMNYRANEKDKELLSFENSAITSGLEKILAEPEEPKKEAKK